MPRIECPGRPDCHIDCVESGYAYWEEPYGPCLAKCDQATAGDDLVKVLKEAATDAKSSGIVVGVTSGILARFATEIAPNAPSSGQDIQTLQRLAIVEERRRFTASWEAADLQGVIRALAEAASRPEAKAA